jgi:replicative DNA helicase
MSENDLNGELPHHLSAERSVLGSLIVDADVFAKINQIIQVEDFYSAAHREIYRAIVELQNANVPVDFIQLEDILRRKELLEGIGGTEYLYHLHESVVSSVNAEQHADVIVEKSKRRKLVHLADILRNEASGEKTAVRDLIEGNLQELFNLTQGKSKRFESATAINKRLMEHLSMLAERGENLSGLSTGFDHLDAITQGLRSSELIVLAARPSMGKTALALNLVYHVAVNEKKTVGVFSLEMPAEQLMMRILAGASQVGLKELSLARLRNDQWKQVVRKMGEISKSKLYVDDSTDLSVSEIRTKARQLQAITGELDLILIDYLQLVTYRDASRHNMNKTQEVAEISRMMKNIARELRIPVVSLSQLSRASTGRPDKRPILSDLRDSGAIEQDADVVMFIHRDDYYEQDRSKEATVAELIVAKNRNGPTSTVELMWMPPLATFYNKLEEEEKDE